MNGALKALLVCAALLVSAACGDRTSPPVDPLAPADGWTFVNYWAKWCKPCIKEIPELNALHAREGFRVLGVNYDGAVGEELQQQLDDLGVGFPTLVEDPAARFAVARPQVLPTTLVIAPGGALHKVLIGPQTEASLLAAAGSPEPGADAAVQDRVQERVQDSVPKSD